MATVLFWNINRKPLQSLIKAIVDENNVDIAVVAEGGQYSVDILLSLNSAITSFHLHSSNEGTRPVLVYSRYQPQHVKNISKWPVTETSVNFSAWHFQPPLEQSFLLIPLHLPSKLYHTADDQAELAQRLFAPITHAESRAGHSRTAIVGDFNFSPFDRAMVSSETFHGVMTRDLAANSPLKNSAESFCGRWVGDSSVAGGGGTVGWAWGELEREGLRGSRQWGWDGGRVNGNRNCGCRWGSWRGHRGMCFMNGSIGC